MMFMNRKIKKRLWVMYLISLVLLTGMYGFLLNTISNSTSNLNDKTEIDNLDNELNLKISGDQVWWDLNFRSRQAINVTNPYSVPLENFTTSIEFNYKTLVDAGRMNSSLKDIRIVEYEDINTPYLRKYYYKIDYPSADLATVWFDTTIPADTWQTDTYLYYGNDIVWPDASYFMNESSSFEDKNFGWIRNGDFELDYVPGTEISNVFGWNFSTDVPNNIASGYVPRIGGIDAGSQHNLSTSNNYQERTYGTYSFKWGDKDEYIDRVAGDIIPTEGHDYVGTLFSYPFIVPTVTGAGAGEIYLEFYRNFRVYDFIASEGVGFFAAISKAYNPYFDGVTPDTTFYLVDHWESIGKQSGPQSSRKPTYAIDKLNSDAEGDTIIDPTSDGAATTVAGFPEIIDVSAYQGELITLQLGLYALNTEDINIGAFGQVDEIKFTYELTTTLEAVEEVMSMVSVIVRDVDGRIVPGAKVSLANNSAIYLAAHGNNPIVDTEYSGENNGTAYFTSVGYDTYDIWVNYTIPYTNNQTNVYNSTGVTTFKIEESTHTFEIEVDIWTIDFEIVDYDKEPLNYGYIEVNYTKGAVLLDNLTLDLNGKATFRWKNRAKYYYKVYYDNIDYNLNPTALNESYIYRSDYDKVGEKIQNQSVLLNTTIPVGGPGPQVFIVNRTFYTNGSLTEFGNKKILSANINVTIPRGTTVINSIDIYYLDKNNYTYEDANYRIYSNITSGKSWYRTQIDMRLPPEKLSNLEGNKYEAYGLRIIVQGINSSNIWGDINVTFNETTNIYNVTDMSKLNIRVVNDAGQGLEGAIVMINSSIDGQVFEVNLTSSYSGIAYLKGYAYGTNQLPLWYLRGYEYNISIYWALDYVKLNVTVPDPIDPQYPGVNWRNYFNYTLNRKSNFTITPNLGGIDPEFFQSKLSNVLIVDTVTWGNNFSIHVNFSLTSDNWVSSQQVTLPATVTYYIKSTGPSSIIVLEKSMTFEGDGIFNTTINSTALSAGGRGELYNIIISGNKPSYISPSNTSDSLFVDSVQTTLSMHDYYDSLNIISTDSQTYGESLNLTFSFSNTSRLKGATLTYEWLSFGAIQFYEDPINDGYYTTTIDTSLAAVWGTKTIKIIATLENYTTQTLFTTISITERPTVLNGSDVVMFLSEKVYALETENFEFNYTDVLNSTRISNPEDASYSWQKLDENGDPIAGENKIGTLNETADHRYILDLDTESMEIGDYFVFITLHKTNYELRNVVIFLTIEDRLTSVYGSTGAFVIDIAVTLNFTYSYTDNITSTSITNLDTQSWTLNGTQTDSGSLGYDSFKEIYYLVNFSTATLPDGTYTITVTFDKQNYTSQVVTTTLVITSYRANYLSFLTLISQSPSNFTTDIVWRDNITVTFNFTTKVGAGIQALADPSTLYLRFLDESLNPIGGSSINLINSDISTGIYNYTFDTSQFLLIGGESYSIEISATKTTPDIYTPPTPILIFFKLQSVLTDLTIHNYTTGTKFPSYTLTEYWNQTLGITFYFGESISSAPITNVAVTYSWAYGSGQIDPDSAKGPGYYSFLFDTVNATDVGTYIISILAVKQNFSNGVPSSNLLINIINRPTQLNLNEDILYVRQRFFVLDSLNFTFDFVDVLTSKILGNADEKSFILHRREVNGDPIPDSSITGLLHETADHQYILDLDTETLQEGEYSVVVTLNKGNYDLRVVVISLTIYKREFSLMFSTDTRINLNSGERLQLTITLTDLNNNSAPIIGADLTLTIRGIEYSISNGGIIDNGDGTYTVNTEDPIAEPFYVGETFIGTLTIAKANFTSETRDFTIVIKMAEIFSGMPTFYFILISAAIIGVFGSLTTYRVIQQARIPKHVKKIRKIKSLIKAKKKITESMVIPTKGHMMAKMFGSEWKEIGLSLDEKLGLEDLKAKKLSLKDKGPEDKIKKDKLVEKKLEKEKFKQDKLEKKKIEREKQKQEKLEKERLNQEKLEKKKLEKQKLEKQKLEKQKLEKQKLEKEKLEKEKLEKEKLENEKIEDNELPNERGEDE